MMSTEVVYYTIKLAKQTTKTLVVQIVILLTITCLYSVVC